MWADTPAPHLRGVTPGVGGQACTSSRGEGGGHMGVTTGVRARPWPQTLNPRPFYMWRHFAVRIRTSNMIPVHPKLTNSLDITRLCSKDGRGIPLGNEGLRTPGPYTDTMQWCRSNSTWWTPCFGVLERRMLCQPPGGGHGRFECDCFHSSSRAVSCGGFSGPRRRFLRGGRRGADAGALNS